MSWHIMSTRTHIPSKAHLKPPYPPLAWVRTQVLPHAGHFAKGCEVVGGKRDVTFAGFRMRGRGCWVHTNTAHLPSPLPPPPALQKTTTKTLCTHLMLTPCAHTLCLHPPLCTPCSHPVFTFSANVRGGEEGILPWCLAPAPSRVPNQVQVGGPEGQTRRAHAAHAARRTKTHQPRTKHPPSLLWEDHHQVGP